MTVRELIEKLSALDFNSEVVINTCCNHLGFRGIRAVNCHVLADESKVELYPEVDNDEAHPH